MQNDYDTQTDNSISKEQQVSWSKLVKTKLDKYRDFRSQ